MLCSRVKSEPPGTRGRFLPFGGDGSTTSSQSLGALGGRDGCRMLKARRGEALGSSAARETPLPRPRALLRLHPSTPRGSISPHCRDRPGCEGLRTFPTIYTATLSSLWAAVSRSQGCSHQRCGVWGGTAPQGAACVVGQPPSCLHPKPRLSELRLTQVSFPPKAMQESPCELLSGCWVPTPARVSACPWLPAAPTDLSLGGLAGC